MFVDDLDRPALSVEQEHHLERVLRLRPGEAVVVSDGRGGWRWCRWTVTGRGAGGATPVLEPSSEVVVEPPPVPRLTVAFAPTKGERPGWAVQKLTEVGVDGIVLLSTDRTVVRWSAERTRRALGRLREVAVQAAAQSRRVHLPELQGVPTVAELAGSGGGSGVRSGGGSVALAEPGGMPPSLAHPVVAVGPEGGWSDRELGTSLPRVSLGPGVLRSETAAVAAGVLLVALRTGTVVAP